MIFRVYTAYDKHAMIKIGNKNQRKIASIIACVRIILLSTALEMAFEVLKIIKK